MQHPYEPLPADEQRRLADLVKAGDVDARHRLVLGVWPLAKKIARKYSATVRGRYRDDLFQESILALVRAVARFDPELSAIQTFATHIFRGACQRFLITQNIIRISAGTLEAMRYPAHSRWQQRGCGKCVRDGEAAMRVVRGEKAIARMTAKPETDTSDLETVISAMNTIDPREALVLRLRYGLDERGPLMLREIGAILRLTRERVRQIERDGLDSIRRLLAA